MKSVSGLWEEVGFSGEIPHTHGENMQLHIDRTQQGFKPEPSLFDAGERTNNNGVALNVLFFLNFPLHLKETSPSSEEEEFLKIWRNCSGSYLQSLDHLPNVFPAVVMGGQHDTLPALVEDLNAHNPWGPPDDVTAGAVKNHIFGLFFNEHYELIRDSEQTVSIHGLTKVPRADAPGDGAHTEHVRILPGFHFLLLLGSQRDEAELHGWIYGGRADKVFSQILQVLLPRASRHDSELLGLVSSVLAVDDFGEQEVPENSWLWESDRLGNGRAERRNIFGSGNSDTGKQKWSLKCDRDKKNDQTVWWWETP